MGTTNAGVVPTQLTSAITGSTLDVYGADGKLNPNLKIEIIDAATGSAPKDATAIGSYTVQVVASDTADAAYAGLKSAKVSYSIVGKSLQGASLFEVDPNNAANVSDTTFTFNTATQNIGVALDGAALTATTDYTVKYFEKDGITPVAAPTDAGNYIAVVTGAGNYKGSEVQLQFSIGKLDLSSADVVLQDVKFAAGSEAKTSLVAINGDKTNAAAIGALLSFSYPVVPTKTGSYSVTLSPLNAAAAENITGSKTLSYNVVANDEVYVQYNNAALADDTIDLSAGESFNVNAIKVFEGADATGTQLTSGQYTVTVTDQKGNTVPASSLATPGKWNVTVAVNSAAMDWALGGKQTATITVTNGNIASGDMFVTYEGNAGSAFQKSYTGQDYLKNLAVKVVVGGKTLVEGVDYKVAYTNGKNEEVTEFVNADTYKVTITSDTWTVAGAGANVSTFTVKPIAIDASDLKVANEIEIVKKVGDVDKTFKGLPYTGKEIVPTFQYATVDADGNAVTDANGNPVYAALPTNAYTIAAIAGKTDTATANAKEIKVAGEYTVTLADNADDPNFVINPDQAVAITVIDEKVFADVPADAWYAQVVAEANKAGYMNGYAGTNLFGPNDKITRAQVACVLFNMAGGNVTGGDDNSSGNISNKEYTSFKDVDPKAYYAQAVAWAKDAGVVNGFAGTDNFGPDQQVTREQFACMLWNYAKANLSSTIKDIDVDAALASKPDGKNVSDWAREGVAWAVQNKIMGNGGVIDPLKQVTRAETAAMVMNYTQL